MERREPQGGTRVALQARRMKPRVRSLTLALLSLTATACGSGSAHVAAASSSSAASSGTGGAGGGTGSGGAGGSFAVAPHEPFPAVTDHGGPVLAAPTLITVTFSGYAYDAEADAFDQWIATSDWLAQTGADYGVGKGSWLKHVTLADAAPATLDYADVGPLLEPRFADATLPDPATLTDALYLVHFPPSSMLTFFGQPSCTPMGDLGGFHGEAVHGATRYAFAALPQCGTDATELAGLEESSAHEMIEAATDPYPFSAPAWGLLDLTSPWPNACNGEVGDLCQLLAPIVVDGHHVPRIWSNSGAEAGDPCVPAAAPPYFNASASPSEVVKVAAGGSAQFEVKAWSTEPMPAWSLQTVAYGDFATTPSLGATTIANGGTTTLTLHVPASAKSGQQGDVLLWSIADLAGGRYNFWPAVVEVQ
jgi:hypothetical protein